MLDACRKLLKFFAGGHLEAAAGIVET